MSRPATPTIDLNCDLGESAQRIADGTDLRLLKVVTSANIACGGHAGDESTMRTTVEDAMEQGVALGAHPGYPDRANFGRVTIQMPAGELAASVRDQVSALSRVARACGGRLSHVKPHGALYHDAMHDAATAQLLAKVILDLDPALVMVAMAGVSAVSLWRGLGLNVAEEAFADRVYEPDGSLRSRTLPGALITDPASAAAQALRFARGEVVVNGGGGAIAARVDTLCIHGDTPSAVTIATGVRAGLEAGGVCVAPLGS